LFEIQLQKVSNLGYLYSPYHYANFMIFYSRLLPQLSGKKERENAEKSMKKYKKCKITNKQFL